MPMFGRKKPRRTGAAITTKRQAGQMLGGSTARALAEYEDHRSQFLRCSGMHTAAVTELVHRLCSGENFGPGVALIAPALYEGIPEHLDKTLDEMGDIAVYASLYMGLVVTAGIEGFYPAVGGGSDASLASYFNGVYASMFTHSTVVFFTVLFRLAAVGHLRDSDKLLFLWRSRYVPLITYILFAWGLASSIFTLLYAVSDSVIQGGACFAAMGDASMHWFDWWNEWTGHFGKPVGAGVVHPEGEDVLNPWILKANELNLVPPNPAIPYKTPELYDKYSEFMTDHFGFSASCDPQQQLNVRTGTYRSDVYAASFWLPYLVCAFWLPLTCFMQFIFPTRNIYHYLVIQPHTPWLMRLALQGGFADTKINDPFDMTEAFEEFKFRAEIGAELAKKDTTGDGFVNFEDHSRSMSRLDVEVMTDDPVDLGGFLETLGLSENYSALAEEFELQDLQSLAKKDAAACLSELEKAGVLSGGHRVKITNALIDLPENRSRAPLPRPQPAAKDVFDPPHAGVEEEEEKTPPFFC